jgi:uncharacterized membrane protein
MNNWFVLIILYIIVTGLWGFFAKFSSGILNWQTNMSYVWFTAFVINISYIFNNIKWGFTKAHWFAIVGGIFAAIGTIIFYKALSLAPASKVIPISSTYIVLTVLLCILFLKEPLTWKLILGIIFGISSIILLSK